MADHAATHVWSRRIGWRQGHILPADAASALGLIRDADTLVMVVSHDCDLAYDDLAVEPSVEVIAGRRMRAPDPSLARMKSPRTLHLYLTCEGAELGIALIANDKKLVPKAALATWRPDARYRLGSEDLFTLRRWLAARYDRAAFPDEFEYRLRHETNLAERIDKIAKRPGVDQSVSGIYFNVHPLEELDRKDPRPYELTVVLLYSPGMDPLRSADIAEAPAEDISQEFRKKCLIDEAADSWKHIHLKNSIAYSEEALSVATAKNLQRWHLDHISLRPDARSARPFNPPG